MPTPSDAPHLPRSAPIEAYGKGGFAFAEMSHRGSLLCLPDAIWAWPVVRAADNDRASLERVFAAADGIDTLIIGTGTEVWLPPSAEPIADFSPPRSAPRPRGGLRRAGCCRC